VADNATIRFVLDGDIIELTSVDPTRTVLQYLREDLRRKGTKEGCAEGDCGACTVVLAELKRDGETVALKAINSCIQFLPTLDGKELITVESLTPDGDLHPVQEAMVRNHGSQCGFCTPGFVMSLYALYESNAKPNRREIDDALAGNLCRCTGYRPIIAAAHDMYVIDSVARVDRQQNLKRVQRSTSLVVESGDRRFFAPQSVAELAKLMSQYPDATLLAGGTDVGLWVTKQHRELDTVVYTGCVSELQIISESPEALEIGAAVSFTDATPVLLKHFPGLEELLRRFASPPIRNAGTLGGNIANGSPIGDSMAALMVLDAVLVLRHGDVEREIDINDFYHDYRVNDLQPGEVLIRIRIPFVSAGTIVSSQKWSKRFDQDISAICTAYRLTLDGSRVATFQMACGGLAGTVRRARRTEASIVGKLWNEETIELACQQLDDDFAPISDMRASADIRRIAVKNLLRRFLMETGTASLPTVYTYGR